MTQRPLGLFHGAEAAQDLDVRNPIIELAMHVQAGCRQFLDRRLLPAETPPLPSTGPILRTKLCNANAGCHAGPWHMVETGDGLRECTEVYGRAGTCRKSTYGTKKVSRLWVVKLGNDWLQCQLPDMGSKCVKVFARPPANLPFDAVQ